MHCCISMLRAAVSHCAGCVRTSVMTCIQERDRQIVSSSEHAAVQAPEAADSQQEGHATPGHHSCSGSPDLSAATGPSSGRWAPAGTCLAPPEQPG